MQEAEATVSRLCEPGKPANQLADAADTSVVVVADRADRSRGRRDSAYL